MVMWAMSDRTLPRTFANMEGFGVHTFRFINKEEVDLRQVSLEAEGGPRLTIWDETVKIAGADPDFQRRNLFEGSIAAISRPGSWACSCSTRRSPKASPTTCSTRRSFPRRCCPSASSADGARPLS
jgi:hypothetical protein